MKNLLFKIKKVAILATAQKRNQELDTNMVWAAYRGILQNSFMIKVLVVCRRVTSAMRAYTICQDLILEVITFIEVLIFYVREGLPLLKCKKGEPASSYAQGSNNSL